MHGCVSNPEEIIITSKDFASFEKGRLKALGGVVQANLLTSHMLFVGFSMTDPNYLRILNEVRRALKPAAPVEKSKSASSFEGAEETMVPMRWLVLSALLFFLAAAVVKLVLKTQT
jgi:hypothetical protein